VGKLDAMSDFEHELLWDHQRLRERVDDLSDLARRSLATAITAQEKAFGTHDAWLDEELAAVVEEHSANA
jgi:hypothetical protein